MGNLTDIVDITISRETQAVSKASFGTPGIISEFASDKTTDTFDRYRFYSSITEMIDDGWEITDNEYLRASKIFIQNPRPLKILIGRKKPAGEVVETWTDALTDIQKATTDWYAFTINSTTEADIKLAAAWAETQKKIYFVTTNDADIITSSTTDIVSDLKALNYDRTVACYHPDVATEDQHFAEAWIGEGLPYDPGTSTWAFKTLKGITAYNLTSGQTTFAKNKNCNIYTSTAGVSITEEGKVVSGEFIDVMMGADWIEADMSERVFSKLVNVRKIPYTDEGVQIIEGLVRETLDKAVIMGILASYTVSVPRVADIDPADKLARLLPDIDFEGILAGAIHKIKVNGTVSV